MSSDFKIPISHKRDISTDDQSPRKKMSQESTGKCPVVHTADTGRKNPDWYVITAVCKLPFVGRGRRG